MDTRCLACNKDFKGLLIHLARNKKCKDKYSVDDFNELSKKGSDLRIENKNVKRRQNYDPKTESERKRRQYDSTKEHDRYKNQQIAKKEDMKTFHPNSLMYKNFFKEIQFGPIFPCICCMKTFTDRGVHRLTDKFHQKIKDLGMTDYIDTTKESLRVNGNLHLCKTCYTKLPKKVMPKQCFKNGLQLSEVPRCLQISSMSNQLIAKYILFIKFRETPNTRMKLMNDRVSCCYET